MSIEIAVLNYCEENINLQTATADGVCHSGSTINWLTEEHEILCPKCVPNVVWTWSQTRIFILNMRLCFCIHEVKISVLRDNLKGSLLCQSNEPRQGLRHWLVCPAVVPHVLLHGNVSCELGKSWEMPEHQELFSQNAQTSQVCPGGCCLWQALSRGDINQDLEHLICHHGRSLCVKNLVQIIRAFLANYKEQV